MSENGKNAWISSLRPVLAGTISFLVAGATGCLVLLYLNNYILGTIIAGGLGGLLLGVCLGRPWRISKTALSGLVSVTVGFWSSFILGELLFSIPSVHTFFGGSRVPDIVTIVLMGAVCGAIFGAIFHGRKAVRLFSVVCAAVALPFGMFIGLSDEHALLTALENLMPTLGPVDLNLLIIVTSLGVGIGLGIGLLNMRESTKPDTGTSPE